MENFIKKVVLPDGWVQECATGFEGCVVLRHHTYGATTIDTIRRLYAPGAGKPNPYQCTMTYKGRGWEMRILIDATNRNASFWNAG